MSLSSPFYYVKKSKKRVLFLTVYSTLQRHRVFNYFRYCLQLSGDRQIAIKDAVQRKHIQESCAIAKITVARFCQPFRIYHSPLPQITPLSPRSLHSPLDHSTLPQITPLSPGSLHSHPDHSTLPWITPLSPEHSTPLDDSTPLNHSTFR